MGKKTTNEPKLLELLVGQRHERESDKAIQACNDWLRLGVGRTIPLLLEQYEFLQENVIPTRSINTLYTWHNEYDWRSRAAIYDVDLEERKNKERESVIRQGLALEFERVKKLKRLAQLLESQIYERDETGQFVNLWVDDVKSVGSRDNAEIVEIVRFNPALLEQYRRVLEDIAKETGGRVQRTDVTTDGQQIQMPVVFLPQPITDDDSE